MGFHDEDVVRARHLADKDPVIYSPREAGSEADYTCHRPYFLRVEWTAAGERVWTRIDAVA